MTSPDNPQSYQEWERVVENVDQDPRVHRATVPDEDAVLLGLYGPPNKDGVYVGREG